MLARQQRKPGGLAYWMTLPPDERKDEGDYYNNVKDGHVDGDDDAGHHHQQDQQIPHSRQTKWKKREPAATFTCSTLLDELPSTSKNCKRPARTRTTSQSLTRPKKTAPQLTNPSTRNEAVSNKTKTRRKLSRKARPRKKTKTRRESP